MFFYNNTILITSFHFIKSKSSYNYDLQVLACIDLKQPRGLNTNPRTESHNERFEFQKEIIRDLIFESAGFVKTLNPRGWSQKYLVSILL